MQDRSQEDSTEQESRTCRSKIVMLHYDESMKKCSNRESHDEAPGVGARIEAKRKGEQKESMITDQFGKKMV